MTGRFSTRPIDRGFLKATNNARLKFAFMWANHDWHGYPALIIAAIRDEVLYPGRVTPETFDKICDLLIRIISRRTNYWRIEGKPYFSFYDLGKSARQLRLGESHARRVGRVSRQSGSRRSAGTASGYGGVGSAPFCPAKKP